MKKILSVFVVAVFILTTTISYAGAAEWSASCSIVNDTMTVTGTGANANSLVSVFVLDEAMNIDEVNGNNLPAMIEATLADSDGNFTLSVILSSGLRTGRYKIYVTNNANTWQSGAFVYVNPGELASLSANVNSATSHTEIKTLLEPFQIVLQMPDLEYTADYLFKIRPSGGYSQEGFNTELQRSAAFYLLSQGKDAVALESYSIYLVDTELGIDCYEQYKNLGASALADYISKVSSMDLKTPSALEDIYSVGVVYSAIYAETWQELQKSIIGGETENAFFTTKISNGTLYDELVYTEAVFQEIFREKSSLSDMKSLEELFDETAQAIYKEENKTTSSGGGGKSSGGGGGGILVASRPEKVTEPPIEEKPVQTIALNDVAGHWAESQIKQLVSLGVVNGYPDGGFYPENAVTRAEFVKMICQLFDLEESASANFNDVSSGDWFAPYVSAAKSAGLVNGDAANCFNPNAAISRQDAAVMLSRLLKLEGADASAFIDSSSISDYAAAHVGALFASGLISGMDDGSFCPLEKTTRAQASVMLLNCKNRQGGAN